MKIARFLLYALNGVIITSCADSDNATSQEPPGGPETPAAGRVNALVSDDLCQKFNYDDKRRITTAEFTVPGADDNEGLFVHYDYSDDGAIGLRYSDYSYEDGHSRFRKWDETLRLPANGLADYCEGIFEATVNSYPELTAKYKIEFHYDADKQLVDAKHYQWTMAYGGYDMEHPWTWYEWFVWENGNLVRHEDCDGSSKPKHINELTYLEWPADDAVSPLIYSTFNRAYGPLQAAGIFGANSKNLVKIVRHTSNADLSPSIINKISFAYHFDDNGRITNYNETYLPGSGQYKNYAYRVDWGD